MNSGAKVSKLLKQFRVLDAHAVRKGAMVVKKIMCVLVALALCLTACGALAQDELIIREKTYTEVELFEDSFYGYVFAQLENTGDQDAYFEQGALKIMGKDGEVKAEKAVFTCYPNVVAPGEKAYLFAYQSVKDAQSVDEISQYALEIAGSESFEERPAVLRVTDAKYVQEEDLFGEPVYRIYVTAKNETDEALFTPSVAFGLYDHSGKLIYVDAMTQFDMGVPAGQSFIMTFSIDDSFKETWAAQGIEPAKVEAIAIVQY